MLVCHAVVLHVVEQHTPTSSIYGKHLGLLILAIMKQSKFIAAKEQKFSCLHNSI